MKHLFLSSVLLGSVMFVTSCGGNAPEPDNTKADKVEIKISAAVSDSRATDTGFDAGDVVGLYVVNYRNNAPGSLAASGNHVDNMAFTYNGTWTPTSPIYWLDNETHADFYLYYPYNSAVASVDAYPFSVKPDQSTLAAYKASDFMTGRAANVSPTASATNIAAGHAMSRIVINLSAGNGFTAESLAAAVKTVKINGVKCDATINLATGAVTATGSATTVTPLLADNVYKALIVPQSVAEGNLITVNANGRDFNLKKAFEFVGGKSHKFTVTLSKTSNGVNVTINPWGEDGTDNGGVAE